MAYALLYIVSRKKDATVFLPDASKVLFFALSVPQISRESLNGFALNSQEIRVWSLARTTLNVKVKGQRSRLPETKMGFSTDLCEPACGSCLVKHICSSFL